MDPIGVPDEAKRLRPSGVTVSMGPPTGVSPDDCGTAEMLIDPSSTIPGAPSARGQFAYFRPTSEELAVLAAGGFIEVGQYGSIVQPFSATIFAAG